MIRKTTHAVASIVVAFVLSFTSLFCTPAFAGGHLSDRQANEALRSFFAQKGGTVASYKVLGVQEIPQYGVSIIDFHVEKMSVTNPSNDVVVAYAFGPGGKSFLWSGKGQVFVRGYNDGRWIIEKVETPAGSWSKINPIIQ